MSDTFTFGTTPEDVLRESLPHKYDMSLNRSDMIVLLDALAESSNIEAMSLRTGILSTLDIEEV